MKRNMNAYLTKDAILSVEDIESEDVAVPQWGGTVRVRGLSGAERDHFEQSMLEGKGKNQKLNMANLRARLIAASVVDEKGKRLFTDADVQELGRKSAAALNKVFSVAQRLSGLTDEDVEELAADLKADPSDGSASASPES